LKKPGFWPGNLEPVMPLQVGDTVADRELRRPDGTVARLSDFEGRPLVVIFLRHLA
jgi:peroxiredoxin